MSATTLLQLKWRAAREKLEKRLVANQDPKNPIVMMMDSGARGNISKLLTACRYAWSDGRSERTYHGIANPFKLP